MTPPAPARPVLAVGGALVLLNLMVLAGVPDVLLPVRAGLAGLLLFVLPAGLAAARLRRGTGTAVEAWLSGLALVLLAVLLGGLALNALLPLAGVARPLATLPVLLAFDLGLLALAGGHLLRPPAPGPHGPRRALGGTDRGVLGLAAGVLVLAVVGAVRLNNGASGLVAAASLAAGGIAWGRLVTARRRLHPGTVAVAIWLLSAALLLGTSLRGWSVSGHDLQREFRLFQLTLAQGHWDIGAFRDPYNACLSVTVLPTVVQRLTGLPPEAVVKLVPDLLFATCPVMVHQLARRLAGRGVALLAALLFVAFPTFAGDMPFLTRQQLAFVFLGCCLLVASDPGAGLLRRRLLFAVLGLGVVVSHYSTTYLLLVVLIAAYLGHLLLRACGRAVPDRVGWLSRTGGRPVVLVIGAANIVLLAAATLGWSQLVTGTNGQLERTIGQTFVDLLDPGAYARSSDTRYSLLGGGDTRPQQLLDRYREQTLQVRAELPDPLPAAAVAAPTPVLERAMLPPTLAGRVLQEAGVDLPVLNSAVRLWIAKLLQLLACAGLLGCLLGARRLRRDPELFGLAAAGFTVVALQVLLPQLSVDYGVLRSFQQSLFLLAPFVAGGLVLALAFLRRAAGPAACGLTLAGYASLTGLLPQALGGYPPQLQLNQAGDSYQRYYVQPQERAALAWVAGPSAPTADGLQSEVFTDRYSPSGAPGAPPGYRPLQDVDDLYPTLLRRGSLVLLGPPAVRQGLATAYVQGDLLTYRYPRAVLSETKDLVYANGSVEIYR